MDTVRLHDQTHVGHVHLRVANLAMGLAFYEGILGFKMIEEKDGAVALSAGSASPTLIMLTEMASARPKPARSTGLYHFAIRVPNRQALAQVFLRLHEHDWPLLGASDHLVSEALYLADPDGNGVEIYIDRPRSQWPRRDGQLLMATNPLDLHSLLAELEGDPHWPGLMPETDIGHVHLQVADLRRAEEFYHDLLGLEVMLRGYPGALFLAAGGYHHHLGVNTWAGVGAPPPPPDAVGLLEFSLHIPDSENWQSLRQRVGETDAVVDVKIINSNPSFLIRDADGNVVRVVCEYSR